MKLLSFNALNLYGDPAEEPRFRAIEHYLRDADADVVALQELIGVDHVHRLAEATGRVCVADGVPAVGPGGGVHHTALLWRPGLEVAQIASLGRENAGMWHSLVSAVFDLGGPRVRIASVHLSPFSPAWAEQDAAQILRAINLGDTPGLVGGDFNGIAADDPDPYDGVPWHPAHAFAHAPAGSLDRRAAYLLERQGRLQDCARVAAAPWQATTGHWPDDHHPPRRLDRWYASWHLSPDAVTGYRVHTDAHELSDHCPVEVQLANSRM